MEPTIYNYLYVNVNGSTYHLNESDVKMINYDDYSSSLMTASRCIWSGYLDIDDGYSSSNYVWPYELDSISWYEADGDYLGSGSSVTISDASQGL